MAASTNLRTYLIANHLYFFVIALITANMFWTALIFDSAQDESAKEEIKDAEEMALVTEILVQTNKQGAEERQATLNQGKLAIEQNALIIDNQNNNTKLIESLITRANEAGNTSETRFVNILNAINDTLSEQAEREANLTRPQQEALLGNLSLAFNTTIPELERNSQRIINTSQQMLNFTRFISESFDEEYLEDEVRQYGQSNYTESQIPIIQQKLDRIDRLLNNVSSQTNGSNLTNNG